MRATRGAQAVAAVCAGRCAVVVLFMLWMVPAAGRALPARGNRAELATPGDAEANGCAARNTPGRDRARARSGEEQPAAHGRKQPAATPASARTRTTPPGDRPPGREIRNWAGRRPCTGVGHAAGTPFAPVAPSGLRGGSAASGGAAGDGPGLASRGCGFELEQPHADRSGRRARIDPIRNHRGYVRGRYAEAVVIAGADASAAVQVPRAIRARCAAPDQPRLRRGPWTGRLRAATSRLHGQGAPTATFPPKVWRLQTWPAPENARATVVEPPCPGTSPAARAAVRARRQPRGRAGRESVFYAGVFSGFGKAPPQEFSPQAVLPAAGRVNRNTASRTSAGRGSVGHRHRRQR